MTWKRVVTAAVLIPFVVGLVLWGSTAILALGLALVVMLAMFEYFALGDAIGHRAYRFWTASCALILVYAQWLASTMPSDYPAGWEMRYRYAWRFFGGPPTIPGTLFLFVLGIAVLTLTTRRPLVEALPAAGISSSGLILVAFPMSYMIRLHGLPSQGPQLLLFALVITWVGDTSAYFVGRLIGKHALAPHLSPKKTWEGTLAGFAAAAVVALVFLPLALASSAEGKPLGTWQDFATVLAVWLAVKPLPNPWGWSLSHWLWPYPGGRLAYVFTVLLCVNVAIASFLLLRRVNGIGYSIGWGRHWSFFVPASFIVFGCIAIPLGQAIHFIEFAPRFSEWKSLPLLSLGILFFTAWPEEFLFRGLLQNMLARASKSDLAGWWTASILFGFSHIANKSFPNWRYVLLASIAGFFYGWTWRKTGSIFTSALVHASVDVMWHFLFRTI